MLGGVAAGIRWVETRDAATHPTICRTAPSALCLTTITQLELSLMPRLKNPAVYKGSTLIPTTTLRKSRFTGTQPPRHPAGQGQT